MQSLLLLTALIAAEPQKPFAITVVDDKTNRGVPLIELKTVHGIRLVTDSNGVVAFHEPGLMNQSVFFHVSGHGYEYPKDGFGIRGKQVNTEPGGSTTLKVARLNIAERLYRITGGGLYRDSDLTGIKAPIKEPLLNAQVVGSDSVLNVVYRGKLYWFWGDTQRPSYPLGNFHVPGATSELPGKGGLDPDVGIDLTYFIDDKGFAKKTCEMPGNGPTWLTSLVVLPDAKGRERMYGTFVKVEPPLKLYARGLVVWDDEKLQFEKIRDIDMTAPVFPMGHATRYGDHVYFAHPYPLTRVAATAERFVDSTQWETYTPLKEGSTSDLDREPDGRLRYAWRKNTPAVGPAEQAKLVADGKMQATESPLHLRDRDTGKPVTAHGGSIAWNDYRQRWTLVFVEHNGKQSFLGEVWYAEADELAGPWRYAVKVATHDRMSFYNPKQHPEFAKDRGRVLYFEGTYTHDFSSNPDVTPRYEYNQVMYRLDLGDARTALPKPVPGTDFLALDREAPGSLPLPGSPGGKPSFFILPDTKDAPAATVPLFEFSKGGDKRYAAAKEMEGYLRKPEPAGRVWPTR
jgi:hypothetical protein